MKDASAHTVVMGIAGCGKSEAVAQALSGLAADPDDTIREGHRLP
ncbi:hypothetical protein [Variovorax boronicumulans]